MSGIHSFFLSYKCTIGFAVIQVVLAVFIQQTFKVASRNEEIMIVEQKAQTETMLQSLKTLFRSLDASNDNKISRAEFDKVMHDTTAKARFSAIGVDAGDLRELWNLLDDGDGILDEDEFIDGLKALRGLAKSTDIFLMKRQMNKLQDMMVQVCASINASPKGCRKMKHLRTM